MHVKTLRKPGWPGTHNLLKRYKTAAMLAG